jgi:DNA mismatch repair protein PMS2
MATQHATSKIRSFDDIYRDGNDTSTLGFRGEALFSLANLSQNLVVATRTASEPLATKLEFRQDGRLDDSKTCSVARKVGTTVAVVKLFHRLPVRRADLSKTIKSQRDKLLKLMQGCKLHLCVFFIYFSEMKGEIFAVAHLVSWLALM